MGLNYLFLKVDLRIRYNTDKTSSTVTGQKWILNKSLFSPIAPLYPK